MSGINKLSESLSNWKALGEIKTNDKLRITEISNTSLGKVTIDKSEALQNVFRTLNKVFAFSPIIIDGANTSKWIGHFQTKTLKDLVSVETDIQTKSFEELVPLLTTLTQMRDLIRQSDVGFTNLANTYGDSRAYQNVSSLKESILLKKEVNEVILHTIEKRLNEIKMKGIKDDFKASVNNNSGENSAKKGVTQVQEYVKGNGVAVTKTSFTKNGETVFMPEQFHRDVTRIPYIQLNGIQIYDNKDPQYSVISVYHALDEALGNSENALMSVMNLTTQGMFADAMLHVMEMDSKELGHHVAASTNPDASFQYSIKVVKDEVYLTLKNSYSLRNNWGEEEGYVMTKREFKLSLDELKELDPTNQESSLKTVKVRDTYSPIIHYKQVVAKIYPNF